MKQPAQIGLFLNQLKLIVESNGFVFINRQASIQFMAARGLSIHELTILIMSLSAEDCFDGPEPDRDPKYAKWTVAEFCPKLNGEKIYLKLSIRVDAQQCKCLSVKLYTESGAQK